MTENEKHIIRVAMRAAEIESRVTQDDVDHIDQVLAATRDSPSEDAVEAVKESALVFVNDFLEAWDEGMESSVHMHVTATKIIQSHVAAIEAIAAITPKEDGK